VQHLFAAIQMLDKFRNPAVVLELTRFRFASLWVGGALVRERDREALVQEGQFAQPLRECIEAVFSGGEDRAIGQETDLCAAFLAGAGFFQLAGRLAF